MAEMEKLQVRVNPMQISSLAAFANISGRFQSGAKDVYFIRYIGYEDQRSYIEQICRMDEWMAERMRAGRGGYLRLCRLEARMDPQTAQTCAAAYDRWREKGERGTSFRFSEALMERSMEEAIEKAIQLYRASSPGISQSMERNFGIKLLYWIDAYLPRLYKDGAADPFPKLVLSGDIKIQEYLFLYILVCLGCDVLWLNPQKDLTLSKSLLELSCGYPEKNRGEVLIPDYAVWSAAEMGCNAATRGTGSEISASATGGKTNSSLNAGANINANVNAGANTNAGASANASAGANTNAGASANASASASASASENAGVPMGTGQPVQIDRTRLLRHPSKNKRSSSTPTVSDAAVTTTAAASGSSSGVFLAPARLAGPAGPARSAGPAGPEGPAVSQGARRQLEYEELARLSPGIVMISAYDKKKECFKTGSGVIISEKGYILTNFHVACEAAYYGIRFEEEEQIYGTDELVKYNQLHDLAIIKIDRRCQPICIYPGGKDLVRGQKVVAIGSPLGLFNSVSDGIISGFRVFDDISMIQFTAPISHGSSGGALLNLYGELIGIITAGFDNGQNINLAVDYKTVMTFARGFL